VFDRCKSCVAEELITEDAIGGVQIFDCTTSTIKGCEYDRTNTTQTNGCAFAVYSGYKNDIVDCTVFGGTYDGDISLFGTGAHNRITGCKVHSHLRSDATQTPVLTTFQGICVDSSQLNCTVESCYAQGYYYGIDVKSNISNCLVANNTVYRNKVGIAARRGETNAPNMGVTIEGNLVIPATGNGDSGTNFGAATLGILIEDCSQATISNNKIGVSYLDSALGAQSWRAITIIQSTAFNFSQCGAILVTGNEVNYQQALGPYFASNTYPQFIYASGGSGSAYLSIQSNTFTASVGKAGTIAVYTAKELNVTGNVFTDTAFNEAIPVPAILASNVNSVVASSNSFYNRQQIVNYRAPVSGLAQLIVANNTMASTTFSTHSMIATDGMLGCVISGNIRFRTNIGSSFTDSRLLEAVNATAASGFALVGNVLRQTNFGLSNFYRIDGVDAPTGANIIASNAVG
jgi:parallel beta-helix repeat protein